MIKNRKILLLIDMQIKRRLKTERDIKETKVSGQAEPYREYMC